MEPTIISINDPVKNSTHLKHRIMQMNAKREDQEMALKEDLKELYYSLQPSTIIRKTLRDLNEDLELKDNAIKTTLDIGKNFILDRIMLKKGVGIKSYLLNVGLKKLFSYFISKNNLNILHKSN